MSGRFSNKYRLGAGFEEEDLDDIIERSFAPQEEQDLIGANGSPLDYSSIERYLSRIPPREADLTRLYYRDRMKQEQIAKLFRITQAAVSYRLHRGIRRIQFLRTIPELERDGFELELGSKFSDQDREILWRMYETTCQSEIAKQMGLTQGRVRHRFFRGLQRIKELIREEVKEKHLQLQSLIKKSKFQDDDLAESERELGRAMAELELVDAELKTSVASSKFGKYWTVFFAISDKHFNILHEVSLPQFRDRGDAQILTLE
jgi:DNA-directed RNA polymerase specialized sigma24 family protein